MIRTEADKLESHQSTAEKALKLLSCDLKPDQAVALAWRAALQQCSGRETHHSGVSFRPAWLTLVTPHRGQAGPAGLLLHNVLATLTILIELY